MSDTQSSPHEDGAPETFASASRAKAAKDATSGAASPGNGQTKVRAEAHQSINDFTREQIAEALAVEMDDEGNVYSLLSVLNYKVSKGCKLCHGEIDPATGDIRVPWPDDSRKGVVLVLGFDREEDRARHGGFSIRFEGVEHQPTEFLARERILQILKDKLDLEIPPSEEDRKWRRGAAEREAERAAREAAKKAEARKARREKLGLDIEGLNEGPCLDQEEAFREHILEKQGFAPDFIITDDEIHSYSDGFGAGWYVYHDDPIQPWGVFADFHEGEKHHWKGTHVELTPEQQQKYDEGRENRARILDGELKEKQQKAAERAKRVWEKSDPNANGNPYLGKKKVGAHGVRECLSDNEKEVLLVVPVRIDDEITSLQFIAKDGRKEFVKDGAVKGGYHLIGGPIMGTVAIVEGLATGATVHEATGLPVAVAFFAKNLKSVAKTLRAKYPKARILIAGDNDHGTEKKKGFNPGKIEARKAAEEVNGATIWPTFEAKDGDKPSDWNDFAKINGNEAVAKCFMDCLNEQPREQDQQKKTFDIPAYEWCEACDIPMRDFLYGHHLLREVVSGTVAPGGSGKSAKEIVDALSMATGRQLLDDRPTGKLRVAYWNGEDSPKELKRRVVAACQHYKIAREELGDRLHLVSGLDQNLIIASEGKTGATVNAGVEKEIISYLKNHKIDVLIIDPFVASHAINENNNMEMNLIVKAWAFIAKEANCAIELVHHTRKGNGGNEVGVDDARGASALVDGLRAVRALNTMSKDECSKAGVNAGERKTYFRSDDAKLNFAPPARDSTWYRIINVKLSNGENGAPGDNVGVVTTWEWPKMAGLNEEQLKAVEEEIKSGAWATSASADNWAGVAIARALDLDIDDKKSPSREKVKTILADLIEKGALKEVDGAHPSAKRKQKQVVVAPRPSFART